MNNTRDIQTLMREQVIPAGSSRFGVVIGIEKYQNELLNLRCARADAQAVYDLMIDPECGMFQEDNVILLLDNDATRENIRRALAGLKRKVCKNDTVWIYYAGHAAPEDDDYHWVPYDADIDDLFTTGLARTDVSRLLNSFKAERVIAFLDCCHAAVMGMQRNKTRAAITAEEMFNTYKGTGFVTISASGGQEKSIELTDKGHGAFTWFLLKGLRGEADQDRIGVISLDSLWKYLQDKVVEASGKQGNTQTPVLIGEITHNLPLTVNPLETKRKKAIADKIHSLIGIGKDRLTTREAEMCLDILRRNTHNSTEKDIAAEFDALVNGNLRPTTFKKILTMQGTAKEKSIDKTVANTLDVSPDAIPKSEPKNKQIQPTGKSIDIEVVREKYLIKPSRAVELINDWSVNHKEYLWPLCDHANIERIEDKGFFFIVFEIPIEIRKLTHKKIPLPAPIAKDERIFKELCKLQSNPNALMELQAEDYAEILNYCPECNGTGKWECDACYGDKKIQCSYCDGTGKYKTSKGCYSTGLKCDACHGRGLLTCLKCREGFEKICPACKGLITQFHNKDKRKFYTDIADRLKMQNEWLQNIYYPSEFTNEIIILPQPSDFEKCLECNGTGTWKCTECYGNKKIPCPYCDGTGMYKFGKRRYSTTMKCSACHGKKILPCTTCQGNSEHTCNNCKGTGYLIEYPGITIKYEKSYCSYLILEDRPRKNDNDAQIRQLIQAAVIIDEIDTAYSADISLNKSLRSIVSLDSVNAVWKDIEQSIEGKFNNIHQQIYYLPKTEVHIQYVDRVFALEIMGKDEMVTLNNGEPPTNFKYLVASKIGIPCTILLAIFWGSLLVFRGCQSGRTTEKISSGATVVTKISSVISPISSIGWFIIFAALFMFCFVVTIWGICTKPKFKSHKYLKRTK